MISLREMNQPRCVKHKRFSSHHHRPLSYPPSYFPPASATHEEIVTGTPLPIVLDIVALSMYPDAPAPLTPLGRAANSAAISAPALASRCLLSKLSLPSGAWRTPPLSERYSTRPLRISSTASTTLAVTVPTLGLGIIPFGPRIRATWLSLGIMSGWAMALSNAMLDPPLFWISLMRSWPPTTSAPAACAASTTAMSSANTATRMVFPEPWGRTALPRTFWSPLLGSTPRLMAISSVSSNLARASLLTMESASEKATGTRTALLSLTTNLGKGTLALTAGRGGAGASGASSSVALTSAGCATSLEKSLATGAACCRRNACRQAVRPLSMSMAAAVDPGPT
mmetsp:Transcript_34089/g.108325  ORF Transcript_34089/g.108325 Transcript_34089/m.108325 type:complete len:340 (-) Transcript_34089:58-1077(-)